MTAAPAVFTRIVERRYDECRDLVSRALAGVAPVAAHGATRFHVELPVGRRRVRMRLEVAPWRVDGKTTALELVPLHGVRGSRRYFRAGHRLLDELTATITPRGRACRGPGHTESRSVDCAA